MASTDDPQALRERVETLEAELEELTSDEVTDEGGRSWTPADLMNIGLTRRQSLVAFSAIAGGATFLGGVKTGMSTAAAETSGSVGQVGTTNQRVDVYSDLIDANQVSTGALNNATHVRPGNDIELAFDGLEDGDHLHINSGEYRPGSILRLDGLSKLTITSDNGAWIIPQHDNFSIRLRNSEGCTLSVNIDGSERPAVSESIYLDTQNGGSNTDVEISNCRIRNERIAIQTRGTLRDFSFHDLAFKWDDGTTRTEGIWIGAGEDGTINNVRMVNTGGATNDDGIALKSIDGETHNIDIRNVLAKDMETLFAFGTEIHNPMYNITCRGTAEQVGHPIYVKPQNGVDIHNIDVSATINDETGENTISPLHFNFGNGETVRDSKFSVNGDVRFANSDTGRRLGVKIENDGEISDCHINANIRVPDTADGNPIRVGLRVADPAVLTDTRVTGKIVQEGGGASEGVRNLETEVSRCTFTDFHLAGFSENFDAFGAAASGSGNLWYVGSSDVDSQNFSGLEVDLVRGVTSGSY